MGQNKRAALLFAARQLSHLEEDTLQRIERWQHLVEAWMTDVDTALADFTAALTAEAGRIADAQAALQAEIDALTASGTADTAKLQAVADSLETATTNLNAIDPATIVPPVPVASVFTFNGDANPGDQNGIVAGWALATGTTDTGMSLYVQTDATQAVDTSVWTEYDGVVTPPAA